jgi:hypothetical protein
MRSVVDGNRGWHRFSAATASPLLLDLRGRMSVRRETCEVNTFCLLRLRRTDNRPNMVDPDCQPHSADSRCYPVDEDGVRLWKAPQTLAVTQPS